MGLMSLDEAGAFDASTARRLVARAREAGAARIERNRVYGNGTGLSVSNGQAGAPAIVGSPRSTVRMPAVATAPAPM